ncbi:MAG: hypothetical protein ACAH83_01420 [Alphaproteobacteria bacterium]
MSGTTAKYFKADNREKAEATKTADAQEQFLELTHIEDGGKNEHTPGRA